MFFILEKNDLLMSSFPKTVWTKIRDGFEKPTTRSSEQNVPAPPYSSRTYAFDGDVIVDLGRAETGGQMTRTEQVHRPIFTVGVGVFDVLMLIVMFIVQRGFVLRSDTWIKMGGKYVPCMRPLSSKAEQLGYNSGLKAQCHAFLFPYQVYRFFTPMFLHGGFSHLLNNLVYQALAGSLLERKYGTKTFAICYLLFGFSGNVMSALSSPKSGKSIIMFVPRRRSSRFV
jgi:membrane associated rhomboid family serine protease